jgi:Fe-S-cluster containining protein
MVTYLGFFREPPVKRVNPSASQLLKRPDEGAHYYSCKHFDHKDKVCTIYEIRPEVCRAYPYGKKCEYAGCTWTSHKIKKETRTERGKRLRELKEKDKLKLEPGGDRKKLT